MKIKIMLTWLQVGKKSEKQKLLNYVFNSVAQKYDLMNDITSLVFIEAGKMI